jgi:hypothetical protein
MRRFNSSAETATLRATWPRAVVTMMLSRSSD